MDDVKKKVIDEIIALMDEEETNKLKKHPKLMAAKISIEKEKPMMAEEMPMDKEEGEESEDESEIDMDELDPEMLEKLAKMLK